VQRDLSRHFHPFLVQIVFWEKRRYATDGTVVIGISKVLYRTLVRKHKDFIKPNSPVRLQNSVLHDFSRPCRLFLHDQENYSVHTRKRDVTRRLIFTREGLRVAVLTSDVPPENREAWFAQKVREGVQVTISHPKITETGIDLQNHSSLIFF
jgi:hypothetical protein